MSTPPPLPQHPSNSAAGPPRSGQDQPEIEATRRIPTGERALVLHGGGSAGNAWEIGVIAGLVEAGVDVTDADLIVGTSAGPTAAAQITSARPSELLAAILAAAPRPDAERGEPAGGRAPIRSGIDHLTRTNRIIAAALGGSAELQGACAVSASALLRPVIPS